MSKLDITKSVVNNMTGYTVGTTVAGIINTHRKHSDNKLVDLAITASSMVTGWVVGGMVHDAVRDDTNARIDKMATWFNETFKENADK